MRATVMQGAADVRVENVSDAPDVLDGCIEPGRVFDRFTGLDGDRAMNDRESIKVLIELR